MFSRRIQKLSPSLTIAISQKARELKAQGRDILSFSAGEPDFDTPEVIKYEAIKAITDGFTKYTNVAGIPELLEAIKIKLKRDNHLDYDMDEIIVSNGAKQSLFNIFATIIDEGDEVIIPAPYWVTYPELVKYHGGIPVIIQTDEKTDFKITPEMLKKAITPKTKALMLTSPSNPTGSIYTKKELTELSKVLKDTNIWVISDEMYEKLIYEGEFTATASINEDMLQRTITVNGLSKSHAMTGWRFGYCASKNKELIKKMITLQSQSTSNINTITQKAAIPALLGKADGDVEKMVKEFKRRRDFVYEAFNSIEGLSAAKPHGAFYIFVNHKKIINDSMSFALDLLEEKGVAVVPGLGFGSEGYFRFSFATDFETINKGIKRIEEFVKELL
ncbi:aspartate aminotransferase [Lebetimonas natsushimae]|uniref:Aspartate aminotransferase n=1 Tax=Lebetimonas natsushimae TaxID=1936991 RepID=A0A292YAW9_9BACT|nr:pyridoxal phosphate-dependent aminotransferase [Lebetimonas natsushimae]GAX88102.1 aspartate aminotransferase [Lebetimonas natsushimae]